VKLTCDKDGRHQEHCGASLLLTVSEALMTKPKLSSSTSASEGSAGNLKYK